MLAATLAPLVLGGCIMPVAVQIASIFADAVSLMTTDKTLSDHGLSAATNQDCAVWRIFDGEEVCRDYEPGDGPVMVADANSDAEQAAEELPWRPVEASDEVVDADDMAGIGVLLPTNGESQINLVDADEAILVGTGETEIANLEPIADPAIIPAIEEDLSVPAPPTAENMGTDEPMPASAATPAAIKTSGGTFFVIASFSRISGAKRFARRHAALATRVLAGTAKGKAVYRVAVGPVDKAQRPAIRTKLVGAGFDDVWALKLKSPKIVVELAELN